MAVTINGTTGINTPGVVNTAGETIATTLAVTGAATVGGALTVTGAVQGSGVATNLYPLVSGTAVASTSGTSIDFTSIPSWVKRITVMLAGVSSNSTSGYLVQLGDSGGIETSGYGGATSWGGGGATTWASAGFNIFTVQYAASLHSGSVVLTHMGSNVWTQTGVVAQHATGVPFYSAGSKTLSDTLTQIRFTTVNGTDTFDAGSINILYE